MRVQFHNTHAYPGCQATVADELPAGTGEALAEFSDGSVAAANYQRTDDDQIVLHVAPYTTARRTHIPAKAWMLARGPRDQWRVAARLAR